MYIEKHLPVINLTANTDIENESDDILYYYPLIHFSKQKSLN